MNTARHRIEILFPILLLVIFAALSVSVTLFAARTYQHTAETSSRSDEARIAVSYVTETVHRFDAEGCVRTGTLDGCPALIAESSAGADRLLIYIYYDGGCLKELYTADNLEPRRDMGTSICRIKDFDISMCGNSLIRICCTAADGSRSESLIGIRSN